MKNTSWNTITQIEKVEINSIQLMLAISSRRRFGDLELDTQTWNMSCQKNEAWKIHNSLTTIDYNLASSISKPLLIWSWYMFWKWWHFQGVALDPRHGPYDGPWIPCRPDSAYHACSSRACITLLMFLQTVAQSLLRLDFQLSDDATDIAGIDE